MKAREGEARQEIMTETPRTERPIECSGKNLEGMQLR